MSDGDIKVLVDPYGVIKVDVASGAAATIGPGEPVVRSTNYGALISDGMLTTATDYAIGIAATESTDTASAAGTVDVVLVGPGSKIRGKAKTSTTLDTAAELLGAMFDCVPFDVTSSVITLDVAAASGTIVTYGNVIVGGDYINYTADCIFNTRATLFGADA